MKESEYQRLVLAIATFVESRKLSGGVLVPDAEGGFNLACDFISSELKKLCDMDVRRLAATLRVADEKTPGAKTSVDRP
jgi:hypothetical protein